MYIPTPFFFSARFYRSADQVIRRKEAASAAAKNNSTYNSNSSSSGAGADGNGYGHGSGVGEGSYVEEVVDEPLDPTLLDDRAQVRPCLGPTWPLRSPYLAPT